MRTAAQAAEDFVAGRRRKTFRSLWEYTAELTAAFAAFAAESASAGLEGPSSARDGMEPESYSGPPGGSPKGGEPARDTLMDEAVDAARAVARAALGAGRHAAPAGEVTTCGNNDAGGLPCKLSVGHKSSHQDAQGGMWGHAEGSAPTVSHPVDRPAPAVTPGPMLPGQRCTAVEGHGMRNRPHRHTAEGDKWWGSEFTGDSSAARCTFIQPPEPPPGDRGAK